MRKILLISLFGINIIFAQNEPAEISKVFFGYVGDISVAPIGGMGGKFNSHNIGFYVSFKLDTEKPSDNEYMSTMNYNEAKYTFEDTERGELWNDIGISVGITQMILPSIFAFGGISYFERTQYVNFFDKYYILGDGGNYYVDGPEKSKSFIGFNLGAIFLFTPYELNSFYLLVGSNINPTAFEVGIGYSMNWF